MLDVYFKYCDLVPSALGVVLQEPGHIIAFLSVFVQSSIKNLQRLVAKQTLKLSAFGEA